MDIKRFFLKRVIEESSDCANKRMKPETTAGNEERYEWLLDQAMNIENDDDDDDELLGDSSDGVISKDTVSGITDKHGDGAGDQGGELITCQRKSATKRAPIRFIVFL